MAENNKPSKEDLEKMRSAARDTLENKVLQNVIGSTEVQGKNRPLYGEFNHQIAQQAYQDSKTQEDYQKRRIELEKQRESQKDSRNPETPQSVSNYEITQSYLTQLDQSFPILTLGELEGIVGNMVENASGKKPEYSVPDKLKDISYIDFQEHLQKSGAFNEKTGEVDESKISEDMKGFIELYQSFNKSYPTAAFYNLAKGNYFSDLNNTLKKVHEKYNPSKK